MHIGEVQENAKTLCNQQGWDAEPLQVRLDYIKSELEEVLVEVMYLIREPDPVKQEPIRQRLGHEIFDMVWNLCELANRFDIDLEQSFKEKVAVNDDREFSQKPKRGVISLD